MNTQELTSERSDQNAVKMRTVGPAAEVPSWHSLCWLAGAVFSLLFADGGNTIALAAASLQSEQLSNRRLRQYFVSLVTLICPFSLIYVWVLRFWEPDNMSS
jgi:hypothetical protein